MEKEAESLHYAVIVNYFTQYHIYNLLLFFTNNSVKH